MSPNPANLQSTAFTAKANGRLREIVTDIHLSLPFLPNNNPTQQPLLFSAKALWDTGATNCAITEAKAKQVGLPVIGKVNVCHADGESIQNVYLLNLYLPNKVVIPMVRATECKSSKGSFDFIIGMDVITIGDFAITNVGNNSTVSFRVPSTYTIDFVKEIEAMKDNNPKVGRNYPCPCGSGIKYKKCHGA